MKTIQTASIVGWNGNFGQFIKTQLAPCLKQVHSIDTDTIHDDIPDILNDSDLIVFATPIRHTANIIRNLSEHIVWDKLVIDITGLKTKSIKEMTQLNVSEIISIHPMFKHNIDDFRGKKITKTTIQSWAKWRELESILEEKWCNISEISAQEHDNKMAVIQALPHITNMIFMETLKQLDIHPDDLAQFSTPIYQAQSQIGGRFLSQSAALFADMQIHNTEFQDKILPELVASMQTMHQVVSQWDSQKFERLFQDLWNFLWDDFLKRHNGEKK